MTSCRPIFLYYSLFFLKTVFDLVVSCLQIDPTQILLGKLSIERLQFPRRFDEKRSFVIALIQLAAFFISWTSRDAGLLKRHVLEQQSLYYFYMVYQVFLLSTSFVLVLVRNLLCHLSTCFEMYFLLFFKILWMLVTGNKLMHMAYYLPYWPQITTKEKSFVNILFCVQGNNSHTGRTRPW